MQPVYHRVMNEGAVHGSVSIRVHLHIVLQQGGLFVFLLPLSSLSLPSLPPFLFFPTEVAFTRESRARISHPRCSVKTETCRAPLFLSRWRDRFDAENVVDTPRLSILEFLNIQQCIVFWRRYEEPTRLSLPFSLFLSLILSFLTFIYTWSISAAFPRYSNIGMIFADKLHFIRRPVIN